MPFKTFESDKPLVYIHVYKTGGTTIAEYLRDWFHDEKNRLHRTGCRRSESILTLDKRIEQLKYDGICNPIFYGHFLEDHIPTFPKHCNQFITTIRNPFDRIVSSYFYERQLDEVEDNMSLEEWILTDDIIEDTDLTEVFGKEIITLDNYKQIIKKYFIYIGLFEKFNTSILKLATVLEKPANIKISRHLNKSEYTTNVPNHLREFHRKKYPLEYAIYDYIVQLHNIK